MELPFRDRAEAGRELASRLDVYKDDSSVLVLALPRGGVPVAFEVARYLHVPLDVFLVRKLGVPGHEELAFGAIATGGIRVLNHDIVRELGLSQHVMDVVSQRETEELQRREQFYRQGRSAPDLRGHTVILTDDGLATGATMLAAARAVRAQGPARLVVAVPVASAQACNDLRRVVDDVVCADVPEPFHAVGLWYRDFTQTTDDEVSELLDESLHAPANRG